MNSPPPMSARQRQKELEKAAKRRSDGGRVNQNVQDRSQQMEFRSTMGLLRELGTGEKGRDKMYLELKDKAIRTDNPAGFWSKQALEKKSKSNIRAAERCKFNPDHPKKLKYGDYISLTKAWTGYINDLIPQTALENKSTLIEKIKRAEILGAEVCINRADAPSMIGLRGIVIEVTARTLRIISSDSRVRRLPLTAGLTLQFTIQNTGVLVEGRLLVDPDKR